MSDKIIGGASNSSSSEKIIGSDADHSYTTSNGKDQPSNVSTDTIKQRIASSTKAGGLEHVPDNFDYKKEDGGDWISVNSDDCFEVLYLDFRQHERITPEIVHKNYELISNFWKEKSKAFAGGNRERLKAKYGEDTLTNAFKRLDRAYEQLRTSGGISLYFEEINKKRYDKGIDAVRDLVNISVADGEVTKNEANTIIAKAISCDLTEQEIRNYLLELIKEKGYKPRSTKVNPDPFDNRWMTDEKWKEAQSRYTTINGKSVSSLEEYGEVLFDNEEYTTKHLRTINYITQEVTKLHSTDKAMEFEDIIEKEPDTEKRSLKVIYHLNPSLPFKVYGGGGIYETIFDLLSKGFENHEIYERLTLLFEKEHIQIWLNESDPNSASKLPSATDYRSFLKFAYKINDQFPFYLKDELFSTPYELIQKVKSARSYWYKVIENFKNGYIPTWFQGIGKDNWLSAYNNNADTIINSNYHTEEETNLACVQGLIQIIEPSTEAPSLTTDKNAIELLSIEGSDQVVNEPLTISISNPGFVKARFSLDTEIEGVTLDSSEYSFFSHDDKSTVTINLVIDSSKLVKNKVYDVNIKIQTLYETISVPTQIKAVFPTKAFALMLLKYAAIFLGFFGLVRYCVSAFTGTTSWLSNTIPHYYSFETTRDYLPPGSYGFFFVFLLLVGGLIGSIFIIRKFEKL